MNVGRFLNFERWDISVTVLIITNLVPLLGVWFLGWSVASLFALYWLETLIIGLLNYPKILATDGGGWGEKLFICIFFSVHFGIFLFGHRLVLVDIFKAGPEFDSLFTRGWMFWAALSLLASHLFSTLFNYFSRGEYKGRSPTQQMFAPYGRVVILHIVIIVGGALAMAFGSVWALIVLVILKIVTDIGLHNASHILQEKSAEA